jgi:NAD(P)-dependent dehydrogenase (short-subunit alcohol dehydrogenase family)
MVRGVAGSAALEFAEMGCRVNTVVATGETPASDVEAVVAYLRSDDDAGFTTGATIDLTEFGVTPKSPRETVALVTGGAGGLGRAAAERMHAEGFRVIISDLPGNQLDKTAEELGVESIGADLGNPAELERIRRNEALNGLNALFLHHGVGASSRLDENYDSADGHRSVSVNGTSVWDTFNTFLPALQASGNATVVMLSSVAGLRAEPGNGAYGAAKFAVVGFVKGNFRQLASQGIRLHTLCPGPIDTPLMRAIFAGNARDLGVTPEEFTSQRLGGIPLKRAGQPHHIGAAASLLARLGSSGIVLAPTGGEVLT